MKLIVLVWWLGVISASGELVVFEYRYQSACQTVQRGYARVGLKTTVCQQKHPARNPKEIT